ncbi:MAG: DNA-processing protein DprA [Pseudomonadota bacterium]
MDRDELRAWLRLTLSPGVGNEASRKLLATFGSAQAIFEQRAATLKQLLGDKLGQALAEEPATLDALLQTTITWLASAPDRQVVTLGDTAYPASLLNIADPPLMLYMMGSLVKGSAAGDDTNCLAIVGSRNPTPQGEINARQFAKTFGASGMCVVSGLAMGVDGAAHDGALLGGGTTIAVVGTGLDRVYPKKHLELAHRIAASGMIVSEFPLGTPPISSNFPKRNRIISGLSQGTLVIEAALKSGSLITARMATEQGKEVFAIPGSIHSPQSRGCHWLIKQGAKLVENAEDVLEELQLPVMRHAESDAPEDDEASETAPADAGFMSALGFDVVSLDALQARTGMPTPELQTKLLELELEGQLTRLPGGLFQRMSRG